MTCALVPLAFDPWGLRPYLPVKNAALVVGAAGATLLAALAWSAPSPFRTRQPFDDAIDRRVVLLAAAFWLWALCAPAVAADSRPLHLLGAVPLIASAVLATLAVAAASTPRWRYRIAAGFAATSLVMMTHALLQSTGHDPLALLFDAPLQAAGRWRAFTTTGNPNWTGAFLAATAPLAAVTLADRPRLGHVALPLLWLLYGATILATGSRLALIALAVGAAAWWWGRQRCRGPSGDAPSAASLWAVTLILLLAVTVGALATPYFADYLPERWHDIDSLYGRLYQFGAAWKLVGQSPWVGHGLGHFQLLLPDGMRRLLPEISMAWRERAPAALTAHAHNDFLETAVESGLVGLALLGAVWILAVLRARKECRPNGADAEAAPSPAADLPPSSATAALEPGLMACLVALAILGLGSIPLQTPSTLMLFWVVVGLVAAGDKSESRPSASSSAGYIAHGSTTGGHPAPWSRLPAAQTTFVVGSLVLAGVACWHGANLVVANRDAAHARDLLAAQQYERAEQTYRRVLRRSPWDHESGMLLSAVLVAQGRPADALVVLDQAERWSVSREAWLVRAEALRTMGKPERAAEVLDGAILAIPDFLRAHSALAALHIELAQNAMAAAGYRRILASTQDSPLARALKEDARDALAEIGG